MKIIQLLKKEGLNWLLLAMPFIYFLIVKEKLPPLFPLELSQEKAIYPVIAFIMGSSIVWYIILLVRPAIFPKTPFNDQLKTYHRIRTLMLAFTSILSLTFISDKIGINFNWGKIGFIMAFAYMMIIGNFYPTIRRNFLIGIKNPWTQTNEEIWKKTHRFAGRVLFIGGLIGLLYGIFFEIRPTRYMPIFLVGYVMGLNLVPRIYSYLLYKKAQKA